MEVLRIHHLRDFSEKSQISSALFGGYYGQRTTPFVMHHLRYYSIALCGLSAAVVGFAWLSRSKLQKPDHEKERRTRLSRTGRLTIGTAMDVQDLEDESQHLTQLLIYRYDVAGVAYEASQDITHLRQFIDVHSCRLGLPASVKYDPHNPGNSIVISETWSGLRK
ncbi:hypothetical protein Acid345_0179 [Candidatus Koribacter versatilis Ellin345]|uniref:DUF3592 domain-containing protein n=1 Tax=Koribacter versatilis (strain Ellin345) TaxID=204669 RepID=Q1IVB6_KORVE|nr:hypothetical protein [Candidatus Koribacter versatilis]ABF39184.1 hypothetical protein Acid345_0179 [Candidatus Koribacter versatilis Ellin345]